MCDCTSGHKASNWCEGSKEVLKVNTDSKKALYTDKATPRLYPAYTDVRTYATRKVSIHAIEDFPTKNCFALG